MNIELSRITVSGQMTVVLRCDVCKEPITDYRWAMVQFEDAKSGPAQFWICHKGTCDHGIQQQHGNLLWWELGAFLGRLCTSAGVNLDQVPNEVIDELHFSIPRFNSRD